MMNPGVLVPARPAEPPDGPASRTVLRPAGAAPRADPDYALGVVMVALAGLFWSTGGVLVRWIEAADAWQIIFYRSLSLAAALLLIVTVRHRGRLIAAFVAAGRGGLVAGACLSGGFIGYVLALHADQRRQRGVHARRVAVLRRGAGLLVARARGSGPRPGSRC